MTLVEDRPATGTSPSLWLLGQGVVFSVCRRF
jgi:hypothetical protein